nr:AAA family ATPase [Orientia tsutsugamushi]
MKGSLIVVDEAGMVGTKAYAELFRVVRNNNCQLILAGDEKQLASIERGGMFEMLSNIFGSHVLVNIRRQSENWSREAATKFAESNILSGITLLRQNKCVKFDNTLQDSISKLIYDWSLSKFKLHEKLVITVRNKDVDILNSSIRSLLKANGTLQGTEYRRSILEKERTKTTVFSKVFSKVENWFKSIINDINDRSHVNEEYYHFTVKPEQEAKVEKVQQENSIKQYPFKDISTPLFMQIKEQRQYDYDVTILSAEGKTISSFQEAGIDSRMVYSSNVNNLKYYQPFQGEKILIAANNDKQNKEYVSTINEAVKVLTSKGAITSIVIHSEGEDFNDMLKNKGAVAVKELMIPEIMKLINTQNVKTESEQVVKTNIAPKIGVRR